MGNEKKPKQWVVLGTGGTIAGTAAKPTDLTGYTAGQLTVEALLESVAGLGDVLGADHLQCEQVLQFDSKDMTHAAWQVLAQRCRHWLSQTQVDGVVVTHGTDTAEETAWFLQSVLDTHKPVVLTCAMRPATAAMPDGPQNLLEALAVVREPAAQGVLVVCAGRVHAARQVQKIHPYRLDAFSSGEMGPCAWVEQGQVRWAAMQAVPAVHPHSHKALSRAVADWPWVEVLHSHAGADARKVHWLAAAGVKGLVVAGTGNGTVHQTLLEALQQVQAQGVVVRLTTRCSQGQIVGQPAPLCMAEPGLQPFKARISLMLDLMD